MDRYIKWVHPKIEIGKSYARPLMPNCFVSIYKSCPTWNIYSDDDICRTEYWLINEDEYAKISNLLPNAMTIEQVDLEMP